MTQRSALAPNNPYYPYILFYIPSLNRFMDHDWYIVHDINELFPPWEINHWKRKGQDAIVQTRDGIDMVLYYLNREEEDEVMDYFSFQESFGVKVDRDRYDIVHHIGVD